MSATDAPDAASLDAWLDANGVKTVGYIGFTDAWGDLVYNSLMKATEPAGIKVVTNERYARSDQSVTGQVLKIVAAHPDAVMTGGSGTPGALPYLALAERAEQRAPHRVPHGVVVDLAEQDQLGRADAPQQLRGGDARARRAVHDRRRVRQSERHWGNGRRRGMARGQQEQGEPGKTSHSSRFLARRPEGREPAVG